MSGVGDSGKSKPDAKAPEKISDISAEHLISSITEIKNGIEVPNPHGDDIPACTIVSGRSKIPKGSGVWVGHTNGTARRANDDVFYNVRHSQVEPGENEWYTEEFTVGSGSKDIGAHFYIFVYLVPDSVGDILDTLKDPPTLTAPPSKSQLVTKIRVKKIKGECPH
ncbi:hypothetical protein JIX56_32555 [Streptomyces sp. CA-210063]|uniref:hypothetical protein n=1 Tax=Streptomyces sp. CA-210063 TaxID=2801029 RepID=UPI00214AD10B|nr:hypothetical protein [Streptomyces sp. CA-210063]UUU34191.1 hypothetical protein JIX56_32555 [Streptomyces sp. CA-210063]